MSFEKFKKNLLIIVLILNLGGENSFAKISKTKKIVIAGGACAVAAGGAIIYKQIDDKRKEKKKANLRDIKENEHKNSQKLVEILHNPKVKKEEIVKIISTCVHIDLNYEHPFYGSPLEAFLSNQSEYQKVWFATDLLNMPENDRLEILELLLENGSSVGVAPKCGKSLIDIELERSDYSAEIVEILINNGAETDDLEGKLARKLSYETSQREPNLNKIKKLINLSGNVGYWNNFLHNVLYNCKKAKDRLKIVNLLLENGADPDSMDNKGNRPINIELDKENCSQGVVDALVDHGADLGRAKAKLTWKLKSELERNNSMRAKRISTLIKNGADANVPTFLHYVLSSDIKMEQKYRNDH